MAIQTIAYLKSKFETGDKPTQQDFYDLLDTMFSLGGSSFDPSSITQNLIFQATTELRKLERTYSPTSGTTYSEKLELSDGVTTVENKKVDGSGTRYSQLLLEALVGATLFYNSPEGNNRLELLSDVTKILRVARYFSTPTIANDLDIPHKKWIEDNFLLASAYNDRYKGKYTTLVALQTAHPAATVGDYAQVDTGSGSPVVNYNWDSEEGWVIGSAGSASNTDGLVEGSTNLYFTNARAIAALSGTLANYILASAISNVLTVTASGSVLDARQGKVLKDLIDALTTTVGGKQAAFTSQTKNTSYLAPETANGVPAFRNIKRRDLKNTLEQIGLIDSDDFSVDYLATRYTRVGANIWTIVANQLDIAGLTVKTLGNYIGRNFFGKINSKKLTISIDITVGTITSTSFGVGLGLQGASLAVQGAVLLDSTNLGHLAFYFNNNVATEVLSEGAIGVTAGDIITLKYTLLQNSLILTATNNNTGGELTHTIQLVNNNSSTYRTPNAGFATVYALGGSHKGDNLTVTNNANKYPKVLFVDDSKGAGSHQSNEGQSYTSFLARKINGVVESLAGGGNYIADANAVEILLYQPDYIFIAVGTNDVLRGDSVATIMASYATLESSLTGYTRGVNLFYVNLPPNNTTSTNALNTQMATTFGTNVCKIYQSFVASGTSNLQAKFSNDGTHLNSEGKRIQAEILFQFGLTKGIWSVGENANMGGNELHSNGAFTALGGMNHIPQYAAHIYTFNKGSQFGITPTYNGTDGLGMWAVSAGHGVISAGCNVFDGATIINTHTANSRISQLNGDFVYSSDSGLTVGAALTPTNRLTFTNSTKVWNTLNGFHLFSGDNASGSGSTIFRQIDGGSDSKAIVMFENGTTISAGATSSGVGAGGAFQFYIGNGTRKILAGFVGFGVIASTVGAETAFMSLSTKGAGGAATERMRCDDKGNVVINIAGLATNATDGFLYIAGGSGAPTSAPTAYTGRFPLYIDTTNNRFYIHNGTTWKYATLT